jgi:uncharacterized protein
MNTIIKKSKVILQNHYKEQFKGLILYGSRARGHAEESSDIDILVLLNQPFDYFRELRTINELLYSLQLESKHLISAKPASIEDYKEGSNQLYRNAKRDGVAV